MSEEKNEMPQAAPSGETGASATAALRDVVAERARHTSVEGWTAEHDDTHHAGEMADAAACYAATGRVFFADHHNVGRGYEAFTTYRDAWPWADKWWKPKNRRRDLVRAGALILAEIERLDRQEQEGAAPVPATEGSHISSPPSPSVGRDEIRREAFEEAAKLCDRNKHLYMQDGWGYAACDSLAYKIRALKDKDLGSPQAWPGGPSSTPSDALEAARRIVEAHDAYRIEQDKEDANTGPYLHALHTYEAARLDSGLLVARALLAASPSPWRDMADAPKDGSSFLACSGTWITVGFWHRAQKCWACSAPNYSRYPSDELPTHWQPLPEPPSEGGK